MMNAINSGLMPYFINKRDKLQTRSSSQKTRSSSQKTRSSSQKTRSSSQKHEDNCASAAV
ncbi:MAG: hypothetical protein KGQ54_00230 [Verrucomicrobia bacterium]|nr:hypothetical protein [Verrucomicrobiota bacterium]